MKRSRGANPKCYCNFLAENKQWLKKREGELRYFGERKLMKKTPGKMTIERIDEARFGCYNGTIVVF
jgi:hypothetical protein